jgi:hypothetical protein
MEKYIKKYWVLALCVVIGGVGGFLYWHYIGCASGTCPITSKWYSSSGYGMIMGWFLGDSFRSKKSKEQK